MTRFPQVIALSLLFLLASCAAPPPTLPSSTALALVPSPTVALPVVSSPSHSSTGSPLALASSTPTSAAKVVPSITTSFTEPPTEPAPATLSATPTTAPTECGVLPMGSFRTIWQGDKSLQAILGCPTSNHPRIAPTAWQVKTSYQAFERGAMIWSDHVGWYAQPIVFVLSGDSSYQSFQDSFDPSIDPVSSGATPPAGLLEPILGFGKVWREQPGVRDGIGWATGLEAPGSGRFQIFDRGYMVWISQTNKTYVFAFDQNDKIVRVFDIPFSEK